MALTPAAMMNLRRGPTMGPAMTPGGAPPGAGPLGGAPSAGLPANPNAADPGALLMAAIAQRMSEHKKANANFASGHLSQILRVIGTMQIHLSQSHPEVARHLNRAWSAIDAARKRMDETAKDEAVPQQPQLGFSGASIGPTQANPIAGSGGGGMGVPT